MGAVSINDVRKNYGNMEVLHGVSVDIADGEFVILVGPSGCGKSTLLRMIAGLEEITVRRNFDRRARGQQSAAEGSRHCDGVPVLRALSAYDGRAEHGLFAEAAAGRARRRRRSAWPSGGRSSGSSPISSVIPRHLSGGQRQRVAMGRAIVRNPAVFLFDEPLSNLDAKLRVAMRSEIKQNHMRLKTTTVYVTHDQIEAMTMADRIVVMHDGVIEQIGSPLDLYDRPANLFVAGFIGSPAMNLLPGKIDGNAFVADDGTVSTCQATRRRTRRQPVTLGVRPEHFQLDPNGLPAEVLTVEPTGSETQVVARFAGQEIMGAFRERITRSRGEIR